MQSILETLFYNHNSAKKQNKAALQRIAANTGMLKKDFNKWQKKRLLHLLDDKDLLAEQRASDSFASGVRFGVIFMIEVFGEKGAGIDD